MKQEIFEINSYHEGLIQNFYAGSKGCFIAFMQFFYQYNQSIVFQSEFADCFKQLYEYELENCQILSEIIIKMGGDNKFYSSARKFLSGYNVDYIKNFNKIFLLNIELLEVNIIEVRSMILKIDNLQIKGRLKTILENKKKSLRILREKYFKNNLTS